MKKVRLSRAHSLRTKIILVFIVLILIATICVSIFADQIYRTSSLDRLNAYIGDTNRQTSINVQSYIDSMDEITFNVLSNSIIQKKLYDANQGNLSEYEEMNISKDIIAELEKSALYNNNVWSLSVISNTGKEYTVQKMSGREIVLCTTKEIMEDANGSSVWNLDKDSRRICSARAILSLSSMKVIGYVNLVCEVNYFNDILKDVSKSYSNGCYILDEENTIVSTNNTEVIGRQFPISGEQLQNKNSIFSINGNDSFYYIGSEMNNGWKIVTTIPASEFLNDVKQFRFRVFSIAMIVMIVGVLSTVLITHQLTKPVKTLLDSMRQFGKGDLKARVAIKTEDEIGKIGNEYNHMAGNIETLVDKVFGMEILQRQAEIEVLKMQINPHFLYNTLDTISWTAMISGNEDVSEMAIILGNLLRANIKNDSFITIEEELKTVKDYLTIQGYRFGDKIQVIYDIHDEVLQFVMPNFILQPIIENAIIHGLEPKVEHGTLKIEINKEQEFITFSIFDDGVGMDEVEVSNLLEKCRSEEGTASIGLKNVYRRLQLYYGEMCKTSIRSVKGAMTIITFTIPAEVYHKQHFLTANE